MGYGTARNSRQVPVGGGGVGVSSPPFLREKPNAEGLFHLSFTFNVNCH